LKFKDFNFFHSIYVYDVKYNRTATGNVNLTRNNAY